MPCPSSSISSPRFVSASLGFRRIWCVSFAIRDAATARCVRDSKGKQHGHMTEQAFYKGDGPISCPRAGVKLVQAGLLRILTRTVIEKPLNRQISSKDLLVLRAVTYGAEYRWTCPQLDGSMCACPHPAAPPAAAACFCEGLIVHNLSAHLNKA